MICVGRIKMSDEEFLARMAKKLGMEEKEVKELLASDSGDDAKVKKGAERLFITLAKKFFGFLNDGSSPVKIEETPFLAKVQAKELEVFGKETAPIPIVAYQSGKKMLYDALVSGIEEIIPELMNTYDQSEMKKKRKRGLWSAVSSSVKIVTILPGLIKMRLLFAELGERVMGQFDMREVTRVSGGELRIADGNIRRISFETGMDLSRLSEYVGMHEELHSFAAQHLELRKCQKNRLDDLLAKISRKERPKFDKKDEDQSRAFSAAVEGHAEFFTQLFAKDLLPGFVLARSKPGIWKKTKWRIIGLDKLMQNYTLGPEFIGYLYKKGGVDLANNVFAMPPVSMEEVINPEIYLKRIGKT